jgi:hypothetical protein
MPAKTSSVKTWLDAEKLTNQGFTQAQVAAKMHKTTRTVERYLQNLEKYRLEEAGENIPKWDELSPEVQLCRGVTADSFELFFNRYSGMTLQPIHKEWVEMALATRRTLINCPPRHAKSEIFSVWFPIWLMARDRNIQIILISQTRSIALKMSNRIAAILASNKKLITENGPFVPQVESTPWRPLQGELMVAGRDRQEGSGDLTLMVRGAGQGILGLEADWVILDDPTTKSISASETERENLSEWFHGEVLSRLEPQTPCFVIGQRVHMNDLYGELAGIKSTINPSGYAWKQINYPAILDWDKHLTLWPQKWGWDELQQTMEDTGRDLFESMYQQNPLPNDRRLVLREWIYGDEEEGGDHPGCLDYDRKAGVPGPDTVDKVRVMSLDPSPTKFAALVVADIDRSKPYLHAEIIKITRDRMSVRDMIQNIQDTITLYAPQYFIFEQNAAQRWLLQDSDMDEIKRHVQVLPHTTSQNKADPVLGVETLARDFEKGHIRLPWGSPESQTMSHFLLDEAEVYPQGLTNDVLMALWFIKWNTARLSPRYIPTNNSRNVVKTPDHLKGGFWWSKGNRGR